MNHAILENDSNWVESWMWSLTSFWFCCYLWFRNAVLHGGAKLRSFRSRKCDLQCPQILRSQRARGRVERRWAGAWGKTYLHFTTTTAGGVFEHLWIRLWAYKQGSLNKLQGKFKNDHPESNQGPSDCCMNLESHVLPTELWPAWEHPAFPGDKDSFIPECVSGAAKPGKPDT